jgi:hypothetical protein
MDKKQLAHIFVGALTIALGIVAGNALTLALVKPKQVTA